MTGSGRAGARGEAAPRPVASGRFGFVTGLKEEVAAIRTVRPELAVLCLGIGPRRAGRAATALIEDGAEVLVSAGIAGGLDPARAPGEVVLAERILGPDGGVFHTDEARTRRWARALAEAGLPVVSGDLVGSARVVASVDGKMGLYALTGAAAVDMESHAVAAVAAAHGVPMMALRVVSDGVRRPIPRAVMGGVARDGSRHIVGALLGLARRPWQIGQVMRLARDAGQARRTLGAAVAALPSSLDAGAGAGSRSRSP